MLDRDYLDIHFYFRGSHETIQDFLIKSGQYVHASNAAYKNDVKFETNRSPYEFSLNEILNTSVVTDYTKKNNSTVRNAVGEDFVAPGFPTAIRAESCAMDIMPSEHLQPLATQMPSLDSHFICMAPDHKNAIYVNPKRRLNGEERITHKYEPGFTTDQQISYLKSMYEATLAAIPKLGSAQLKFFHAMNQGYDFRTWPVDTKPFSGWSLLHYAVKSENLNAVKSLIERGADLLAKRAHGVSGLDVLLDARTGQVKNINNDEMTNKPDMDVRAQIVDMLLKADPALLKERTCNGYAAHVIAARFGLVELWEQFAKHSEGLKERAHQQLSYASQFNDSEVMSRMCDVVAEFDLPVVNKFVFEYIHNNPKTFNSLDDRRDYQEPLMRHVFSMNEEQRDFLANDIGSKLSTELKTKLKSFEGQNEARKVVSEFGFSFSPK